MGQDESKNDEINERSYSETEIDNESEPIKLEADFGDSIKLDKEIEDLLYKKAKLATCKIITPKLNGSGFFCKLPLCNSYIKCLLTNNHVLNEDLIQLGRTIKIAYKRELKKIIITEERICVTSVLLDYTLIEILDKDKIEDFYEIDNNNYENPDQEYSNEDICIMQYPKGGALTLKSGHLTKIIKSRIYHSCTTAEGSSGSPIILLLRKFKVIGIHNGYSEEKKMNCGKYIKYIIDNIINKYQIICEYNIKEGDLGKKIKIINLKNNNFFKNFYLNNFSKF